jgi:hypothetical protein
MIKMKGKIFYQNGDIYVGRISCLIKNDSKIYFKNGEGRFIECKTKKTTTGEWKDDKLILKPIRWINTNVIEWIKETGFGKYCEIFEKFKITGQVLKVLKKDDLIEMGIDDFSDRVLLLDKIAKLFETHVEDIIEFSLKDGIVVEDEIHEKITEEELTEMEKYPSVKNSEKDGNIKIENEFDDDI